MNAKGDIEVDYHHLVEDLALVLGSTLKKCLGDYVGIRRYGFSIEDTMGGSIEVAVDLGARPYFVYNSETRFRLIDELDPTLIKHFFRSFSDSARMNLHITQKGDYPLPLTTFRDMFACVGKAVAMAAEIDSRAPNQLHTSKGQFG